MTGIAGNYHDIIQRIHAAASRSGRSPSAVRLIAVTKTVPVERIHEAVACGITDIGENRLQEALSKREPLASSSLVWHFIGHLQTNKAKKVIENFDWVHSVDRVEIAEALARHRKNETRLPVMIEVKLVDEPGKSGVNESETERLAAAVRRLSPLDLRGLMVVPPPVENPEDARPFFRKLRILGEALGLQEFSMGMTHDFEIAVEEGATMVRIGTGLFGPRL